MIFSCPCRVATPNEPSLSCFTDDAVPSVTRSTHAAVPALLQASFASKRIATGMCIIVGLDE